MSTLATNAITDASGGNTTTINGLTPTVSNMAGRNKIINGSMVFDQRNAGASVTQTGNGYFSLDRWYTFSAQSSKFSLQQNAASVTPPAGFTNYLGATSLSAYSVLAGDYFNILQKVEGFNTADLAWGTASASSITLSFWVRSSLTGTFGGSIQNSDQTRSYPFSYTISTANTWEYETITIPGDTTGTWLTTNGTGLSVIFNLGAGSTFAGTANAWATANYTNPTGATSVVGTSGATFYITGVQLEAGSVATPFENVDYGEMLRRCQRYYEQSLRNGSTYYLLGFARSDGYAFESVYFAAEKRAAPTTTFRANTGSIYSTGANTRTAFLILSNLAGSTSFGFDFIASAEL